METFSRFDLLPTLQNTLKALHFNSPTEIQSKALPLILGGKSIVGVSETGSGKTLAYALPILHSLKSLENAKDPVRIPAQPRAVVVVPTRELGEQVSKVFKLFTHGTRIRVRTALGGTAMEVARNNVRTPFEVLVATPGRMLKLMERGLKLGDVRTLVFDEADQMLDESFISDAKFICKNAPPKLQMVLFSATVSPKVQELISSLFADAEVIRSQGSQRLVPSLTTTNKEVLNGKRIPLLEQILAQKYQGGTLIFANTREQCDKLADILQKMNLKCAIYRGEMNKVERRNNLKAFRDGKINLLISTDLGSRGLDMENVGRVINYHMPQHLDNYIHRVGRTARAGRKGLVINFVTERDLPLLKQLENIKALRAPISRH